MNKTKKNGFLKAAGLMLVVMMLATCVLSGTMAKYTSTGSAGVSALTPAKWDIQVNGSTFETGLSTLSWTIAANKSATSAVDNTKMAPGTWGYAVIKVENKGEVNATLQVSKFTAPTIDDPSSGLTFGCYQQASEKSSYSDITTGGTDLSSGGNSATLAPEGVAYIYVVYQWTYEVDADNNAKDTAMGKTPTEITIGSLTITATQVEPDNGTGD